jgi:hypothetical protein
MNRLPFLLSSIALATLLAGCAESGITLASDPGLLAQAQAGAGATVAAASPAGTALRAGPGHVESILVVPIADAAGRAPKKVTKQITMRMHDGTLQYFNTQGNVVVGDRIEVTSNGTMRRGL